MRLNKGINKDIREQDMPEGMSVDARNIVYDKTGSITNEKGFDLFLDNPDNKCTIGIINHSDGTSVIFSLYDDNVSEIGVMTEEDGYVVKVKDTATLPLFNFNKDYPITGEIERNSLGELVVAWTGTNGDEALDVPRIINLDNLPFEVNSNQEIIEPDKFGQTKLFLDLLIPDLDLVSLNDSGGNLETGAYYLTMRYITADGSVTSSIPLSNPIYVNDENKGVFSNYDGAEGGTVTNKSITFTLSNLDTNYDRFQIGVLKVNNEITSAAYVDIEILVQDPITITYTGKDSETPVPPSEILVAPIVYTGVHTMTQLNRRLYLGNVKTDTPIDYQEFANDIELTWTTKNVGLDSLKDSYKNEVVSFYDKSFMPNEIYSFYIYFILKTGGLSPAYHIPGRAPKGTDLLPSTDPSVLNLVGTGNTPAKFEYEDTSSATGEFGYHENSLETYPDTDAFINSGLSGQKVRHHKFPSLRILAERDGNLNTINPNSPPLDSFTISLLGYEGRNDGALSFNNGGFYNLRLLQNTWSVPSSVGVASGVIPGQSFQYITSAVDQLINLDLDLNITVKAAVYPSQFLTNPLIARPRMDKALFSFNVYIEREDGERIDIINIDNKELLISTDVLSFPEGLRDELDHTENINLNSSIFLGKGDRLYLDSITRIELTNNDLLWNDPTIDTLSPQLSVSNQQFIFKEKNELGEFPESDLFMPILGFNASNIVIPSEIQDKVQGYGFAYATRDLNNLTVLGQSLLVPNDLNFDLNQDEQTRFHAFEMLKERPNPSPDYILPSFQYNLNSGNYSNLPSDVPTVFKLDEDNDTKYIPTDNIIENNVGREEHIRSVLDLQNDITGLSGNIMVDYKLVNSNIYAPFTSAPLTVTGKVVKLSEHVGEVTDIYGGDTYRELYGTRLFTGLQPFQSINTNKIYYPAVFSKFHIGFRHEGEGTFEKYFPKSNVPYAFDTEPDTWDENSDFIGYNRDYDSSNNLIALLSDDFKEKPVRFPYRVARSVIVPKEETELLWRTFLALDYYEMPRNRGVVWNLQGFNETNLLIHCTEMLFTTYSNEVLRQGEVDVVLGSGDIFSRPPREIHTVDKGYAGTTSQFSAHINKIGYTFIDEKRGKIFILRLNQGLQLEEISAQGLKDWYRDNLALTDNFIIRDDNPFNGRGYTMQVDEEENRLLVTKVDGSDSFTRSYDLATNRWVSFHDYKPNYYFFLNNNIYTLGENSFFKINSNDVRGVYFPSLQPLEEDGVTIKPFESYIDVVFNAGTPHNKVFYSFSWVSDVLDTNDFPLFNDTITSIWSYNNYQSSIKFDIARLRNARRTGGKWSFNEMLDIVSKDSRDNFENFLQHTTEHVDLDDSKINNNMSWFNKKRFIHNYVTVRFIFDNKNNRKLALHEVFANSRTNQIR